MKYFYNGEGNAEGILLKSTVYLSQLDDVLQANKITDLSQIEQIPQAKALYLKYRETEDKIETLGIQAFPEEKYNAMLQKHDSRGRLQISKNIDAKSKKSLFLTGQTHEHFTIRVDFWGEFFFDGFLKRVCNLLTIRHNMKA